MEKRYLLVSRTPLPTTIVGMTTYRTIRAAVSYKESAKDYVVAVEDLKVRPLDPSEEREYEVALAEISRH